MTADKCASLLSLQLQPRVNPAEEMTADKGANWLSQQSRTSPPEEGRKGWWQVVWCYERCHKQENDVRCKGMRTMAHSMGASLICLKKATQLAAWLERVSRPQFALITDWREAQPCMQILQAEETAVQPAAMIITCMSVKQQRHATHWVQHLPPEIAKSVIVVETYRIPKTLLGGLVHTFFSAAYIAQHVKPPSGVKDTPTSSQDDKEDDSPDWSPGDRDWSPGESSGSVSPTATGSSTDVTDFSWKPKSVCDQPVGLNLKVTQRLFPGEVRDLPGLTEPAAAGTFERKVFEAPTKVQIPSLDKKLSEPVKLLRGRNGAMIIVKIGPQVTRL